MSNPLVLDQIDGLVELFSQGHPESTSKYSIVE